jgi:hypothetical protein
VVVALQDFNRRKRMAELVLLAGTCQELMEAILVAGDACWCPVVRLELWNGARGSQEKRVLRDMEVQLPTLEIDGNGRRPQ